MVVLRSKFLQAEQERIQAEQSASRKGQWAAEDDQRKSGLIT